MRAQTGAEKETQKKVPQMLILQMDGEPLFRVLGLCNDPERIRGPKDYGTEQSWDPHTPIAKGHKPCCAQSTHGVFSLQAFSLAPRAETLQHPHLVFGGFFLVIPSGDDKPS